MAKVNLKNNKEALALNGIGVGAFLLLKDKKGRIKCLQLIYY